LGDDQEFFPRLVSTFLTVAGYVVFLGALVALMTNWLDRSLAFLASGRSSIFEKDHVLVIGWNERIHALIEELVSTTFEKREDGSKPAIAILCDPYDPQMYRQLIQKLDPNVRNRCRILIRSGNPLEVESLERVDFAHARSIILISSAGGERAERSLSDVTLAKVVMSMKAQAGDLESPPNVVVEVAYSGNKLLVESVGWPRSTEAVVADDIMGRLFCQAVRFPGISTVYQRLLTDTFGDSLSLHSAGRLKLSGKTLKDGVLGTKLGTPIGYLRQGGSQKDLRLLDFDHIFEPEDRIVLVTSSSKRERNGDPESSDITLCSREVKAVTRKILVVGWSTDLMTFLREISQNKGESSAVTLLWEFDRPTEKKRLQQLEESSPNLHFTFLQGALLDESELTRTQVQEFNKILLLADQNQAPLVADAENVLRYVLLDRYIKRENLQIDLVVELNDEDNRALFPGKSLDILTTGEILSHLLAQVSAHRSFMWIYEELFTKGGAELRIRPVTDLSAPPELFVHCLKAGLSNHSVALGFLREGEVRLNPPLGEKIHGGDQLILVEMEA